MIETRATRRYTIADLAALPDDEWHRYEIIDGVLYVSKAPRTEHQAVCSCFNIDLGIWSRTTGLGEVLQGPGLIFDDGSGVEPDVVWVSRARRAVIEQADWHLHGAPELVVEVLSPGATNERYDRDTKLALYSRFGVLEYWVPDWQQQRVYVYRRPPATPPTAGEQPPLTLVAKLGPGDTLTSPLLPGFALPVARLFQRG
jgi:Uma2 family endonuclease